MTRGDRLRIERVGYAHADALRLTEEVQQIYVSRYGGRDDTPLEAGMFEPPQGAFFVGYVGQLAVATGAWRRSEVEALGSTRSAEIKRMYVAAAAQGRGHARAMLAHLERSAAGHGAEVMVLETGDRQPEAIALYLSSDYVAVPGFGYYQASPSSRCYARRLDS